MTEQEAFKYLSEKLTPGTRVYAVLRHCSQSGMSRIIDVYYIQDNEPINITYPVSILTGFKLDGKYRALKVDGYGMDVGFEVTYNLGRVLYPHGFYCPKGYWRNEPLTHDPDGGHALKHCWL